jgi:hypothetical protein
LNPGSIIENGGDVVEATRRILSLALEALYVERRKLDEEIDDLKRRLGSPRSRTRQQSSRLQSRKINAEGRKAISEAMKKHWIERRRRMSKKS